MGLSATVPGRKSLHAQLRKFFNAGWNVLVMYLVQHHAVCLCLVEVA